MAIDGNHSSGAAYFRFAEEMDPEMVQVQVDTGKPKGLEAVKQWIITNWRNILAFIIAILLLAIGILIGHTIVGHPIRTVGVDHCKTNNTARPPERHHLNVTQLFQAYVKEDKLKEYFKIFTSGPHYAGSAGNLELASFIGERWTQFGFEVTNKTYTVTLSRPKGNSFNRIEVVNRDTGEVVADNMVVKPEINDFVEGLQGMLPPFNPYSANNTSLEGDPFFVNYGRIEDFKMILDVMHNSKTVKGNICVARLGAIPLSRLVTNCANEGAIAVLAFPDAALYAQAGVNSVYPDNWWLPLEGIVRDSARSTYGDPSSFFYPSFDDLPASGKYEGSPIPVQVISYDVADGILRAMSNPRAPAHFHSNSSVHTWYMGPGIHHGSLNLALRMVVNVTNVSQKITNVIGIMRGSIEPDRYVIVGNHRDSLTYGGVEPGTGSACLMELSRVLGQLYDQGWRPRRTIILASWDAGEEGHIGSTEWVEEHLEILHERAVAYINLDEAVTGKHTFTAEGSPLLAEVLYQAAQKIDCPDPDHTSMLIYDNWSHKQPISDTNMKPSLSPPGTTSDMTPFLHLAGVPSVDLGYKYDENANNMIVPTYPLMHTAFDNAEYVMNQVDPDFTIHAAVTKVVGEVLLDLADATLLPVKIGHYAESLLRYVEGLNELYMDPNAVDLEPLRAATQEFSEAAAVFQHVVDRANVSIPFELRDVNDRLMAVERAFLGHGGMTLQEQQLRHVIYGPSVSHMYKGVAFPMLANNLVIGNATADFTEARAHLPHMATMIRVAAKVLDNTDTV